MEMAPQRPAGMTAAVTLVALVLLAKSAAEEHVSAVQAAPVDNVAMTVVVGALVGLALPLKPVRMEFVLEQLQPNALEECADPTELEEIVDPAPLVKDADLANVSVIMIAMRETAGMLFRLMEPILVSAHKDPAVLALMDSPAELMEDVQL